MAQHRAGLLADIVIDKRGVFIFEETLIDEVVLELRKEGTRSAANIGALVADKTPKLHCNCFNSTSFECVLDSDFVSYAPESPSVQLAEQLIFNT